MKKVNISSLSIRVDEPYANPVADIHAKPAPGRHGFGDRGTREVL